jgi:hypothetical protein
MLVRHRSSDTDQEGAGLWVEIVYGAGPTYPARAWRTWLDLSGHDIDEFAGHSLR